MPGLRVSWLGLEQPREPPARHFLKAFCFLFCLRSKVLSRFVKLPAFSAGARAEASCPAFSRREVSSQHRRRIFPAWCSPGTRHGWRCQER